MHLFVPIGRDMPENVQNGGDHEKINYFKNTIARPGKDAADLLTGHSGNLCLVLKGHGLCCYHKGNSKG